MKEFIEAGECVKVHGLNGEVKLYPWCDDVSFIKKLPRLFFTQTGEKEHKIISMKTQKNMCILKFEGINCIEDAYPLIGKTAYFSRSDVKLPKGRHFATDVIGLSVKDIDSGKIYGEITDIMPRPTGDIYEVKNNEGQVFLFPAVKEFLKEINIEDKFVIVKPIAGMFDEDGEEIDED